ncbi:PQQ-binding-like beta-propeller repeat protein [Cryptosporangium phraense]|uniref:PQQ-like beta-propeller repeat protein n=1 Tax=Cryptosporangium phraense TaxID=2593070 RepID=A0A545AM66_9ACTN|nr:PQQ-binding-like beta-propeller repeat protein [Cryptosporangium phraense]TQS42408.1 PQQ-like beta-propeller repeat protein [Cryptosporangium phraense]
MVRQGVLLGAVLVVLAVAGGCGGDPKNVGTGEQTSAAPTPTETPAKAFDPPSKFVSDGQTLTDAPRAKNSLAAPPVGAVLVGRLVVYADETELAAADAVTGDDGWVITMPGVTYANSTETAPPVVFDGQVYAAASITVPGTSRVTDHRAIALVAVDPEAGSESWTATIDALPGDPVQQVRLVGVTANSIVLDTSTTTYVVDAQTRRTRWTVQYFDPTVVDGTVVAGQLAEDTTQTKTHTVGLRLTDGVQLWRSETALQQGRSFPLGPGLMGVQGRKFTSTDPYFDFLDPITGTRRYSGSRDDLAELQNCWFDARTIVVCGASGTRNVAVGYDARTLQEIWELPAGDRDAPRITTAWHGAVYGVLNGKAVTLDGHTGAIRSPAAGAAPSVVNEYAGLSADSGSLTLFSAVG